MSIMEIRNIRYSYDDKRNVLKSVNAELEAGKMYAILGASGCGKTTLLSLLGGLDSPQSGQILYNDEDIEKTGLAAHRKNHVLKLSGGQQQRVAIARALASDASVILADEPTGNLDEDTAVGITNILKECAHQMGKCVIIVTHSNDLAKRADVAFRLKKGELQQIKPLQLFTDRF